MEEKNIIIKMHDDLIKHEIDIYKNKIKELENKFDLYEEKINFLSSKISNTENKIIPIITKHIDDNNNMYKKIYFKLFFKKWSKEVYDDSDLFLKFSDDDLIYIASKIDKINIEYLKLIMTQDQFDEMQLLSKLMNKFYIKTLIKKEGDC